MIIKDLKSKLSKVKLLVMDVDGTLTDGAMYYSASGEELKRFSTRDGMGITLLQKSGIKTAIVTSEASQIALKRGEKLKIDKIILGSKDKTSSLEELCKYFEINIEEIAYIGDDVNDLHAMKMAGISACPGDSVESIKKIADFICIANGGNGAVRELCEKILKAQEKPTILTENW